MSKKIILILLAAALAIAGVWYVYTEYFRDNSSEQNMVTSGDKDEGGCLVGAGYSWCESKKKCLRIWEEPCGEKIPDSANAGTQGDDAKMCAQVITTAKNSSTGEIRDFPTPCDVPVGWKVVNEASY